MSESIGQVSIPSDHDGFVLLQCPLCGEFFKIKPEDYYADDVLEVWCPSCGLKSNNYFTDDVHELVGKKAMNFVEDYIYGEMKKMEKKLKGGVISLKVNNKPKHLEERPILAGVEALEIFKYPCCKREAKIKTLYKICGSYCPFCGVRYDEYR
ncbi:TFIIB-type zinc ribbon-containing protein [Anaeromicropila herbilytica]|uniref:TFIIB-type zinc ribbon-containing protein n=1 Tax=Anaeromicropila herbilytica TaxID=2785025 RepID=A0A7R7ENQ4_9FIRM|nr:TFIIB-type zinc ribbon-containing protein [Anaeromicropila herbilytica]BCN31925.1 hypothetical protein bsdtb5_32200 [Anaeromicropila herbilytica]